EPPSRARPSRDPVFLPTRWGGGSAAQPTRRRGRFLPRWPLHHFVVPLPMEWGGEGMTDTIFALATPPGRGAVAILRLSGPGTEAALSALGAGGLTPRLASVRSVRHDGRLIDEALILRFVAPRSYTGEDSAELHLHGGRAVVEAASTALIALGLRPAEPGEFTRRAFQNGRMDLAQAEAVADLIDAETEAQKSQALGQLDG